MPFSKDFIYEPFIVLLGTSIFKYISIFSIRRLQVGQASLGETKKVKQYAGTLSEIRLYPIKSCGKIIVEDAKCSKSELLVTSESGWIVRDRHWMVGKDCGDHYEFYTARTEPRLSMISTSLHGTEIHVDAPNMDTLIIPQLLEKQRTDKIVMARVWGDDIECIDGGDNAAMWIKQYLEKDNLRLIHAAVGLQKRTINWPGAKPSDQVALQDGFPFMLISEASLVELNARLNNPVHMDNFRPNLVATGCQAFDEDMWDEIRIGSVVFRNLKPCTRCIMTTVDPSTGKRHPNMEPLRTLKTYRQRRETFGDDPLFGVNFVVEKTGIIKRGDAIYVTLFK